MKLIDILVQELPSRGGWPEGVKCIKQGDISGTIFLDRYDGKELFISQVIATDASKGFVTREQYEAALAASKVPVWSGEGLPPVGCECEWHDRNTKSWIPVKVLYSSEWVVVIRGVATNGDIVELGVEVYGDTDRCKFRPIRTEAERKRESIIHALDYILTQAFDQDASLPVELYKSIAAGKIPGLKLEDS